MYARLIANSYKHSERQFTQSIQPTKSILCCGMDCILKVLIVNSWICLTDVKLSVNFYNTTI